jgi:uncharacterized protein
LRGAGGVLALGAGLGAYSVVVEPNFRLILPRWNIGHASWPAAMSPLKIAVLTDLHAIEPWMPASRIAHIVETANALEPDITVLLGDYVASIWRFRARPIPIAEWTRPLAKLRARLGVYAILGNHDWWEDDSGVRSGLRTAGIPVLENQAVKINREGKRFWLAGLGDQIAHPLGHQHYRGEDDLEGTIRQTMGDSDPVVLLAHEPDVFVRVPSRVALTLSGHTHGGQVRLPFVGRPVIPSLYGQRFAYGHVIEGGRNLLVSAGLGMTGFPVRFTVPPEIAVVTLGAPVA